MQFFHYSYCWHFGDVFSFTMLVPATVALIYGDGGGRAFLEAFALNFMVGTLLWWLCRDNKTSYVPVRAFDCSTVLGGAGFARGCAFYYFGKPRFKRGGIHFESFSGLTTTGATVITGLDSLPKAILFYRQFCNG